MSSPRDSRRSSSRRHFFRDALRSLLDVVNDVTEGLEGGADPRAGERLHLRPPGALPEATFLSTCERSGACVRACPVQAIQPLVSLDPARDGTPVIVASERACVVCDDLACMQACPSGALQLVARTEITMGVAVVEDAVCKRTFREDCRECVERCPLGESALGIGPGGFIEVRGGCIGCGVCEYYCPTFPRAIRIRPR